MGRTVPAGLGATQIGSWCYCSLSGYAAWWYAVCMFLYFIDYMATPSAPLDHAVSRVDCLPFGLSDQKLVEQSPVSCGWFSPFLLGPRPVEQSPVSCPFGFHRFCWDQDQTSSLRRAALLVFPGSVGTKDQSSSPPVSCPFDFCLGQGVCVGVTTPVR